MTKTKMRIDPQRPGIIRWDDDPLTGILAGIRAAEIVEAVNAHDGLKAENDRMQATLQRIADDDPSGKWGRWAREALPAR